MTVGVGGSTAEAELAAIKNMRGDVPPIGVEERLQRIARAQAIMREKGIDALYLDVSSSMTYFTGLKFRRTERMHSAVLPVMSTATASGSRGCTPNRCRSRRVTSFGVEGFRVRLRSDIARLLVNNGRCTPLRRD